MEQKIDRRKKIAGRTDQSKRSFLMVFSGFIGLLIGIAISFPVLGFLFYPLRKRTVYGREGFVKIGKVDEIEIENPKKVTINSFKVDGWNRFDDVILGATWLVKKRDGNVIVMSTVCPHLGCGIDWDKEKELFVCPCHRSVFNIEGEVVSGPSPRAMDALETKVENNEIFVVYRKLRLGTSKKIEV